jgi:hypothetical protein
MSSLFEVKLVRSESFSQIDQLISSGPRSFRQAVKEATRSVARQAQDLMKRAIAENEMKPTAPNRPLTYAILMARAMLPKHSYRGSFPQSPLFRNQEIYKAIRTVDLRNGDFFVGITGGARSRKGAGYGKRASLSLARIAAIQETEHTIKVANYPKMQRFFIALKIAAKRRGVDLPIPGPTAVLNIPARSFRGPVEDAFKSTGFGEGLRFEMAAEQAFKSALMTNPYFKRFLKVVA